MTAVAPPKQSPDAVVLFNSGVFVQTVPGAPGGSDVTPPFESQRMSVLANSHDFSMSVSVQSFPSPNYYSATCLSVEGSLNIASSLRARSWSSIG